MKNKLNVLIIEDHPIVADGYKNILLSSTAHNFSIHKSENCDDAIRKIKLSKVKQTYDLFLVDIQLTASADGSVTSGEDLAVYIKKEFPNSKIIILTAIENHERIKSIIKATPHDGILIKTDVTPKTLLTALNTVLNNNIYYSEKVEKLNVLTLENENLLDDIDKKIIYHLSKGVKNKDLPKYIELKLSMIEKRKRAIKLLFNISGSDDELLKEAEKRGYI